MLTKVFGAAVQGIDATLITIEVNSSRGCMFYLVGLPDSAVKESHQRIISALQVNGYKMPTANIVINMAPADIRKEGSAYDLPIAIGLLGANEIISSERFSRYLLMGELSLDGSIQPVKGALPIAIKAREATVVNPQGVCGISRNNDGNNSLINVLNEATTNCFQYHCPAQRAFIATNSHFIISKFMGFFDFLDSNNHVLVKIGDGKLYDCNSHVIGRITWSGEVQDSNNHTLGHIDSNGEVRNR